MRVGVGIGVGRTRSWNKARVELAAWAAANIRVASRHGVVLGGEVELNRVSNCGIDSVWRERQSVTGANSDLMDRASCKNSRNEAKERGLGEMHLDKNVQRSEVDLKR